MDEFLWFVLGLEVLVVKVILEWVMRQFYELVYLGVYVLVGVELMVCQCVYVVWLWLWCCVVVVGNLVVVLFGVKWVNLVFDVELVYVN